MQQYLLLKESLMERADKYSMYISDKTGLPGIVNPEKGIFSDFGAQSTKLKIEDNKVLKYNTGYMDSTFSKIELPYACKLLF